MSGLEIRTDNVLFERYVPPWLSANMHLSVNASWHAHILSCQRRSLWALVRLEPAGSKEALLLAQSPLHLQLLHRQVS